jgi:TPR repeat protein
MRTIALFLLCGFAICVHAQDFVIGGQAKSSDNSEKYDSLYNFYLGLENAKKMIGQEFVYYNTLDYTKEYTEIPYPWKDGRLRSGRYTSSQTAKNEYLAELKKKSGTKYKLTDFVTYEGKQGYVFTDNKGESMFYTNIIFVNGEFVCEGYREKFRKKYVGKEVYCMTEGTSKEWNSKEARAVFLIQRYLIGLQSRELKSTLPYMSKWTVKGLGVDTTYWGDHNPTNDMDNSFCRLVFVVHNDELGDYECYVSGSGMLDKKSPKFVLVSTAAGKPLARREQISSRDWNGVVPEDILSSAKSGDPNAMLVVVEYFNDYPRSYGKKVSNVSYDDYLSLLDKTVDRGYIHRHTARWLDEAACHFLPYIIDDFQYDSLNNYEKAVPYFIKATRLGYDDSLKRLMKCIETGKTKDNKAYEVIELQAENNTDAQLFCARQMLKGKKLNNQDKIISWLEQITDSIYDVGKSEAFILLAECYNKGVGVKKDTNKAFEMFIKAADCGNVNACLELGEIYYCGQKVEKNIDKAAYYLKKAIKKIYYSEKDYFKCSMMLGKILVSKHDMDCITYFKNALLTNDPRKYEARIELGNFLYEFEDEYCKGEAAENYWLAYKDGKLEEGKRLFEQYQLKETLIKFLNDEMNVGRRRNDYVEEMIKSLNM